MRFVIIKKIMTVIFLHKPLLYFPKLDDMQQHSPLLIASSQTYVLIFRFQARYILIFKFIHLGCYAKWKNRYSISEGKLSP